MSEQTEKPAHHSPANDIFVEVKDSVVRRSSIKNSKVELVARSDANPTPALSKAERKEKKHQVKMERLAVEGKSVHAHKKAESMTNIDTPVKQQTSKIIQKIATPKPVTPVEQPVLKVASKLKGKKSQSTMQKSGTLFTQSSDTPSKIDMPAVIDAKVQSGQIHSAVHALGLKYANQKIVGGNARCTAMLHAFKRVIADYSTPEGVLLSRHLTAHISKQVDFLNTTRGLSTTMKTAVRYLKNDIATVGLNLTDEDAKISLMEAIDNFIIQRITIPMNFIGEEICSKKKIESGDVVLTYSNSSTVQTVFACAVEKGLAFSVIVIDSSPKFEGRQMAKHLETLGVSYTYMTINAVSIALKTVILGASAVLMNGAIMSRIGTLAVCLSANESNIPVIIAAETYKFSNVIRLNSLAWNEMGDQDEVAKSCVFNGGNVLEAWQSVPHLNILNLNYDLTPPELVTMIVCENGCVPASAAGHILREAIDDIAH